jgi:imidazolonepropionase-like amidohydrolase
LIFSACLLFYACSPSNEHIIAITHATVIDMTGATPLADQTVIIQKDRIANIGASNTVAIPRGAQILDAHGKFLIPGLVDMHIHVTAAGEPDGSRKFNPAFACQRNHQRSGHGRLSRIAEPAAKRNRGQEAFGPRIFTPGPYLVARRHRSNHLWSPMR